MPGKLIIVAAAGTALACASGCLISTSSRTSETGQYVSPGAMRGVAVNQTTEEELIDRFGQPSRRRTTDDPATEILVYQHTRVKESHGHIFLLFSGKNRHVTNQTACFQVTDGVVTRYWTEE